MIRYSLVVTKAVRIIAEADSTPEGHSLNTSERVVGHVMMFGQGDCGQLGLGEAMTERKKPYPVAGQLEGLKIVQVECGGMHSVVLTEDGKVCPYLKDISNSSHHCQACVDFKCDFNDHENHGNCRPCWVCKVRVYRQFI